LTDPNPFPPGEGDPLALDDANTPDAGPAWIDAILADAAEAVAKQRRFRPAVRRLAVLLGAAERDELPGVLAGTMWNDVGFRVVLSRGLRRLRFVAFAGNRLAMTLEDGEASNCRVREVRATSADAIRRDFAWLMGEDQTATEGGEA
jgi:hypothetical protein